jgi:mono/diheme cytochrome c family protein
MRRMIVAVAALSLLGASVASIAQDQAMIDRGEKVYAEQRCAVCHSIGDKGNRKGPLDGVGSKYTEAEMREWIVNPGAMEAKTGATRKPTMKAYPNLSAEDLDALIAYMMSLKK